jgi:chromosome segregation protein
MEAAKTQLDQLHEQIREQFEKAPETLLDEVQWPEEIRDIETCRNRREQYIRQREAIGPVNLRADVEAKELESELNTLLQERDDLLAAVQELRQGITKLDKQARERLLASFENVNYHFQHLFQKLFGGGKAYLALIDSDDPLGAGLEVYAEPPGKSLQSLSLLSGGEQTLASIALIFAMFLTNPAPICVLDEIDAPLDDSNVDRVCDLLETIVEQCDTRFLVITHHRLTMARMNRLYGVTMPENGVSQLVSVDLEAQFDMLEAAE